MKKYFIVYKEPFTGETKSHTKHACNFEDAIHYFQLDVAHEDCIISITVGGKL